MSFLLDQIAPDLLVQIDSPALHAYCNATDAGTYGNTTAPERQLALLKAVCADLGPVPEKLPDEWDRFYTRFAGESGWRECYWLTCAFMAKHPEDMEHLLIDFQRALDEEDA